MPETSSALVAARFCQLAGSQRDGLRQAATDRHQSLGMDSTVLLKPVTGPQSGFDQSVAFGWRGLAYMMIARRRSVSTRYQIRPPLVTSICHCGRGFPPVGAGRVVALKAMMSAARDRRDRIGTHQLPGQAGIAGGLGAQFVPALAGVVGTEDDVPFVWAGWWCDPVTAFRAHAARPGSGTGP